MKLSRYPRLILAAALGAVLVSCDDDPSGPSPIDLTADVLAGDTIRLQDPLRVLFNRAVDPQTALDPENFVVINQCTGLRVPGALRLASTGDTLTFSPSEALPFLTILGARIQNVLDPGGIGMRAPVTFTVLTEAPPVTDVSWELLNSPTNDPITGASFIDRDIGYIITRGGALFRSTNGGAIFGARFKDVNLTFTNSVHAFGPDTVFMIGALLTGGTSVGGLVRSTDGGQTFQTVGTVSAAVVQMVMHRLTDDRLVAAFGGQFGTPEAYHFDSETGVITRASGVQNVNQQFSGIGLSTDAQLAAVTAAGVSTALGQGFAYRSTDGGLTYTPVTLPGGTFGLRGVGFVNSTDALLLGDSSVVLRLNVATGIVTPLGAANGIPQTVVDAATGEVTAFSYSRAAFTPDGEIGWVIGRFVRRRPGEPDVSGGVILISRDGGQTFQRQAIRGVPDNGLAFPVVSVVQALAPDFAVLGGLGGLVALRPRDIVTAGEPCTFTP